jgi:hypothetical protein
LNTRHAAGMASVGQHGQAAFLTEQVFSPSKL